MSDGYNGWANRSTWNVVLWMNNDEPIYLWMLDTFRGRYIPIVAKDAKRFFSKVCTVNKRWPKGATPDGFPFRDVDWSEVARAINEHLGLSEDKETA